MDFKLKKNLVKICPRSCHDGLWANYGVP